MTEVQEKEISDEMLSAMNWNFKDLKDKIIDLNLPCEETVQDLIRYIMLIKTNK